MKLSKSGARPALPYGPVAGVMILALASSQIMAAGSGPLEEITVTATKRDESLQEVPAAITAFTASDIERNRITRPADFIELTPGVVLSDSNHPGEALITIRGTAQTRNTETPVAVVVDGVLLTGRTAFNGELFDISQIEVLKGPQGYLYGRNAIGGAIVIQTRRPENEWQRSVTVGYGNYNHARARFSAGGALIEDELFLQFSGSVRDRDGFYQNITRGEDMDPLTEKVGRARLIWEPKGTDFTADFRISATDVDASSTNFRPQTEFGALQSNPFSSILDINRVEEIPFVRNVESKAKQEKQSYALKLDYDAAFGSFTSVTTYDNTLDVFSTDNFPYYVTPDTTQYNVVSHRAWSQELRFTSPAENRLRYQLGAYYVFINNGPNVHVAQGIDPGGFVLDGFAIRPPGDPNETVAFNSDNVDTSAWAAFFVLNYDLTDTLELTVAGRYDQEDKDTVDVSGFSPFYGLQRSETFDEFQPKVSLAWRPTEDLSFYGGYARGFQAGGFNGAQTFQNCVNAGMCPFDESINEFGAAISDSYEVGFKGRFLDRRLSVSAALFYEEKENTQQFQFLPAVTGNIIQTIDESEVLGFELESEAQITDSFVMTGGFAYIDSEITKFAAEPTSVGNQLPFVPEFTATITATHFWDIGAAIGRTGLTLVSGVQYEHRGEQFFEAGNVSLWERESLDLVNARIALESDDGWTLSFWGRNLTDKIFAEDVVPVFTPASGLTTAVTMPSRPRTWGFEFSYDF